MFHKTKLEKNETFFSKTLKTKIAWFWKNILKCKLWVSDEHGFTCEINVKMLHKSYGE